MLCNTHKKDKQNNKHTFIYTLPHKRKKNKK